MNSLPEKEGRAGNIQMVYFDPPSGICHGSNFHPFVNKRDVKVRRSEGTQGLAEGLAVDDAPCVGGMP